MDTEPEDADDAFELFLRRAVTNAVTSGLNSDVHRNDDIIARLMDYEQRAHQERLSSQTLQVILSGRRLIGE